jgi:hypothetical protein
VKETGVGKDAAAAKEAKAAEMARKKKDRVSLLQPLQHLPKEVRILVF